MDVFITKRYRGQTNSTQNPSSYNYGGAGNTIINNFNNSNCPVDAIATFNETNQPAINDWTIYAGEFGQYPKFMMLITYEEGLVEEIPVGEEWEYEFTKPPKRIRTDGFLTSIVWDLPNVMSGYIIISK